MNALAQNAYNYFAGNIKAYKNLEIEVEENQAGVNSNEVTVITLYYPMQMNFDIKDEDSKMTLEELLENYMDDEELDEKGFDLYESYWDGLSVRRDGVELYRIDIMGRSNEDWDATCEAEGWTKPSDWRDFA